MERHEVSGQGLCGESVSFAEDGGEHIHHADVSPDGQFLATVNGSGALRIVSALTLEPIARSGAGGQFKDLPATCVRWVASNVDVTQNPRQPDTHEAAVSLVSTSTAGAVFGWRFDGVVLERCATAQEPSNEIASVDVSPDGSHFVTAGSDRVVRVYNMCSFSCEAQLTQGVDNKGNIRTTHVNRVLSARYVTPTLIVSAGLESPVQLWDVRTRRSFAQVHDVRCCSDCVEPMRAGSAMFLVASGNCTGDELPILLCNGTDGSPRREESEKICGDLRKSARKIIAVRIDANSGLMWCLSLMPHAVTVVSTITGGILGHLSLKAAPMNICLSPSGRGPSTAYISCHGGAIVRVWVAS